MIWILSMVCMSVALLGMYGRCTMAPDKHDGPGVLSMAYTKFLCGKYIGSLRNWDGMCQELLTCFR